MKTNEFDANRYCFLEISGHFPASIAIFTETLFDSSNAKCGSSLNSSIVYEWRRHGLDSSCNFSLSVFKFTRLYRARKRITFNRLMFATFPSTLCSRCFWCIHVENLCCRISAVYRKHNTRTIFFGILTARTHTIHSLNEFDRYGRAFLHHKFCSKSAIWYRALASHNFLSIASHTRAKRKSRLFEHRQREIRIRNVTSVKQNFESAPHDTRNE